MQLKVAERLILLQIIPPQTGSLAKLKIARTLRDSLGLDEEEYKFLEVRESAGKIEWNSAKDTGKEIEIGEIAHSIIADAIKAGDAQETLREEWTGVVEKFMPEEK